MVAAAGAFTCWSRWCVDGTCHLADTAMHRQPPSRKSAILAGHVRRFRRPDRAPSTAIGAPGGPVQRCRGSLARHAALGPGRDASALAPGTSAPAHRHATTRMPRYRFHPEGWVPPARVALGADAMTQAQESGERVWPN